MPRRQSLLDYKRQAMLYVPAHLPRPSPEPAYAELLAAEIEKVVTLTEGRAFLLFTSRAMMNTVYEKLLDRLPFPLFKQGDLPPAKLVAAFREEVGNGCLLGVQTFGRAWTCRARALSCVIIDKLPFAVPDLRPSRKRERGRHSRGRRRLVPRLLHPAGADSPQTGLRATHPNSFRPRHRLHPRLAPHHRRPTAPTSFRTCLPPPAPANGPASRKFWRGELVLR